MDFLGIFSTKPASKPGPLRIPAGTFTMDSNGRLLTSTLPQSFSEEHIHRIAQAILKTFKGARDAQLSLTEVVIHYSALRITARDMRGGAIVFLAPHGPAKQA
ncbi:MAG: hypothetical protein NTW03_01925 [Verrucomicrobia bacterium]|nr:hypothetical protein [Verrucomicrobiota bacterium]